MNQKISNRLNQFRKIPEMSGNLGSPLTQANVYNANSQRE